MEKITYLCAWCSEEKTSSCESSQEKRTTKVSHGICPTCLEEHFPNVAPSVLKKVA